jgi:hypothetical protein
MTRSEAEARRAKVLDDLQWNIHDEFDVYQTPDGTYVRQWGRGPFYKLELIDPTAGASDGM